MPTKRQLLRVLDRAGSSLKPFVKNRKFQSYVGQLFEELATVRAIVQHDMDNEDRQASDRIADSAHVGKALREEG